MPARERLLLALVEAPDHVCARYRVLGFQEPLAAHGWRLEVEPLAPFLPRRIAQFRAAARADVCLLQRRLLPVWQLAYLRHAVRALVFDVDDAVFGRDSFSSKNHESWLRTLRFWATVFAADRVLAGNPFLVAAAQSYAEPDAVAWLPTCIDPQRYLPASHEETQARPLRAVWIGQRSNLPALEHAAPLLTAAADRLCNRHHRDLSLRVICDAAPRLPQLHAEVCPWSQATEAAELAHADLGIAWMPDDPWSQGKCGLKVLQYMAAGLPVVANPVGVHRELIVHGETGFLADGPQQWAHAIACLATDAALRRRMGAAGRDRVTNRYSVHDWGATFVRCIESAADRLPPRRALATAEQPKPAHPFPRPGISCAPAPSTALSCESSR